MDTLSGPQVKQQKVCLHDSGIVETAMQCSNPRKIEMTQPESAAVAPTRQYNNY